MTCILIVYPEILSFLTIYLVFSMQNIIVNNGSVCVPF